MKVSTELANKLLQTLGVNVQVAEDGSNDANIEEIVSEYHENAKSDYKSELSKELTTEIEGRTTAKVRGSLASALARAFNVPRKDLADIENIEEMAKVAKSSFETNAGKSAQEWQSEREQLLSDIERLQTEKETEVANANATWKGKFDSHFIDTEMMSQMSKAPKKGGDVATLSKLAKTYIGEKYTLKWNDETKQMEAFNGEKLVKDFNMQNEIKSFLESINNFATDTRDLPPSKVQNQNNYALGAQPVEINHNGSGNFADVIQELG